MIVMTTARVASGSLVPPRGVEADRRGPPDTTPASGVDDRGGLALALASSAKALILLFPSSLGFRFHDHLGNADRPALGERRRQTIGEHRAPHRSRSSLAEQRFGILGHGCFQHLAQIERLELLTDVLCSIGSMFARLPVRSGMRRTLGSAGRRQLDCLSNRPGSEIGSRGLEYGGHWQISLRIKMVASA